MMVTEEVAIRLHQSNGRVITRRLDPKDKEGFSRPLSMEQGLCLGREVGGEETTKAVAWAQGPLP